MPARLVHFSDDSTIMIFKPWSVLIPAQRKDGRDWLNGPLVWAIDPRRTELLGGCRLAKFST